MQFQFDTKIVISWRLGYVSKKTLVSGYSKRESLYSTSVKSCIRVEEWVKISQLFPHHV